MKFRNWEVKLAWDHYGNGRKALMLLDAEDGGLILTASVNLPLEPLFDDEIAIKDYSENHGVLAWLMENNVVEAPTRYVPSGFVLIPICELKAPYHE